MSQSLSLEQSYLAFVEFLLLSKKRLFEIGAQFHLTGMQTTTLLLLETPKPIGAFRHIFNCDASNITGIIDGLEQKGLVKRYEINSDRRIKMVKLLSKGTKARSTMLHLLTSDDQYILSSLTENEAKNFISLVQKITSAKKGINEEG